MEEKRITASAGPHMRNPVRSGQVMLLVLIALLPASVFGVWRFGGRALALLLLSAGGCVLTECIYEKLRGFPMTAGDCSAAVTGLLLALSLPSSAPWWLPVPGGIFAILAVKQLFGGLGRNILNPALAARCLLQLLFQGAFPEMAVPIGEASVLALMIGAMLLIWFDVISLRIPGTYLLSFSAGFLLFREGGLSDLAGSLSCEGVLLGAFFMATDYVTSPVTAGGKVVYGCAIGLLNAVFRLSGIDGAGTACAILLGNLLTPLIDRLMVPAPFGEKRKLPNFLSLPVWKPFKKQEQEEETGDWIWEPLTGEKPETLQLEKHSAQPQPEENSAQPEEDPAQTVRK